MNYSKKVFQLKVNLGTDGFAAKFYQIHKELIPVPLKLFHKTKERSAILIPKLAKDIAMAKKN